MKIGILSDSHDHLRIMHKAMDTFQSFQVHLIVHAGDYVAPFAVDPLIEQPIPWIGVLGNNDGEILGLYQKSGGKINSPYQEWREGDCSIWVSHYYRLADVAFASSRYDLCIYGHTHHAEIRQENDRFLINPGETAGVLTGKPTIAICDLDLKLAQLVEL